MDPEAFKQMVWDNAYKKPYDNYLETYWNPQTRTQFTGAAKTAYLKSAHEQHHDGSLTEDDRKIAMHVAGLPPGKTYLSATPDDLKTALRQRSEPGNKIPHVQWVRIKDVSGRQA